METLKYLMPILQIAHIPGGFTADSQTMDAEDVAEGYWPWHVILHGPYFYSCGGSLLNHEWVLTAAHCVTGTTFTDSNLTVYLGNQKGNSSVSGLSEVVRGVQSIIPHPDYEPLVYNNDIALLRLNEPVNFTGTIGPISLAANDSVFHHGTRCLSTGWGHIFKDKNNPETLLDLQVQIVLNKECQCRFQDFRDTAITPAMICAERETQRGPRDEVCYGDPDGLLLCQQNDMWLLAGVASIGLHCGFGYLPDSFTRVSNFQYWILEMISEADVGFVTFTSEERTGTFLCAGDDKNLLICSSPVSSNQNV